MRGLATLQWSGSASARCIRPLGSTCEGGYCNIGNLWRCGTGDTNQESLCWHYIEHWWKKLYIELFFGIYGVWLVLCYCPFDAFCASMPLMILIWTPGSQALHRQKLQRRRPTSCGVNARGAMKSVLERHGRQSTVMIWFSGNELLQVWSTRFLLQSIGACFHFHDLDLSISKADLSISLEEAYSGLTWLDIILHAQQLVPQLPQPKTLWFFAVRFGHKIWRVTLVVKCFGSQAMQCHLPLKTTLEHAINLVFGKRESCQNDTFQVWMCTLVQLCRHPESITTEPDS